jgi:hypothetical protein
MLRRLADDSADVVAVALGLPMLRLVPPASLFEALASIVSRPSSPEKQRSEENLKAQRGSARKVCDTAGGAGLHASSVVHLLVLLCLQPQSGISSTYGGLVTVQAPACQASL